MRDRTYRSRSLNDTAVAAGAAFGCAEEAAPAASSSRSLAPLVVFAGCLLGVIAFILLQ